MCRWSSLHLNDASQLVTFVLPSKQRVPGQQFHEYTRHAPHVDRRPVPGSEDDLRSTVEPRLDVSVDPLVLEAARAKVDHLQYNKASQLNHQQSHDKAILDIRLHPSPLVW